MRRSSRANSGYLIVPASVTALGEPGVTMARAGSRLRPGGTRRRWLALCCGSVVGGGVQPAGGPLWRGGCC
jgi:hypothetical protein